MKTYTRYEEVTVKGALQMLADNDGRNIKVGMSGDAINWKPRTLSGVVCNGGRPFVTDYGVYYLCCARVIEVNPRNVPEGCPPLPEDKPWLAYVPSDVVVPDSLENPEYWGCEPMSVSYKGWSKGWSYNQPKKSTFLAIDVRTDFANEHFPQIVECFSEEDWNDPCRKAWEELVNQRGISYMSFKAGWGAAIAWKESK